MIGKGDALTWWAAGMAVEKFGWRNPNKHAPEAVKTALQEGYTRTLGLSVDEYGKLLTEAYRASDTYKKKKGEEGTKRHETLEIYVKECLKADSISEYTGDNEFVAKFAKWAKENIKKFLWSEAHCYSLPLWVGGIADVGWVDMQDRIIAGDFKSSPKSYFEQFIQIAGYDIELSENGGFDAEGKSLFTLSNPVQGYCVIPFGSDVLSPEFQFDTESYRAGFRNTLALYKLSESFTTTTGTHAP